MDIRIPIRLGFHPQRSRLTASFYKAFDPQTAYDLATFHIPIGYGVIFNINFPGIIFGT